MLNKMIYLLVLFIASHSLAQDNSLYEKKIFIIKGDTMPYRLLLPENYDPGKKYPLLLFMHGSGEKGNNNTTQLVHGGSMFIRDSIRQKYPAFVVIPQCAIKSNWVDDKRIKDSTGKYVLVMPPNAKPTEAMQLVEKLIKKLMHEYPINKKKVYVGGLSLGGMGTYDIVKRNPKLFAAAFPICGAADVTIVPKLKHVNWWVFHGANDNAVSPEFDKNLVAVMKEKNIQVQFTLYPNTGHNSWDKVFLEPNLFSWLFSNTKK